MKAIQIHAPGGPEALQLADGVAVPEPKSGEVLVKLAASGVNFIDVYFRSGHYPAPHLPFTPGMEGAGRIEAVGPDAGGYRVGERVAWAMVLGSYAEYAVVPVARLARLPNDIRFRDGAAIMLQGMTAHYLVNSTYPLQAGQTALVHAGAGGAGLLITQLAKAKGANVITTVSTEEKAELSRGAGADHAILYTQNDFAAEVKRLTDGAGVDVVYDSVGKTTFEKSLDSLRPRGYMVLFGASSGAPEPLEPQKLAAKGSLYLTRPTLANYSSPAEIATRTGDLFAAIRAGTLELRIEHEYPLAEAARAHADLEGRRTTGKLVLLPDGAPA
jgi:NADPH2:quinone reductase